MATHNIYSLSAKKTIKFLRALGEGNESNANASKPTATIARAIIMATITNRVLTLRHDHEKKLVTAIVTCNINFTALELCQMKNCSGTKLFKLKCQLWGADSGLTGADDFLFTYSTVFFFPDATPTATESRRFEVILGEGVLDEDWGEDEVYGLLKLINLSTLVEVKKKTNTVSHSF